MNKSILLFLMLLIFSVAIVTANEFCYQESVNTLNQTGIDGLLRPETGIECNLHYTGSFTSDGTYVYINYTTPTSFTNNSLWQVKMAEITSNISLTQECFNEAVSTNTLQLRLHTYIDYGASEVSAECFDGINWTTIRYDNPFQGTTGIGWGQSPNIINDGNWDTGTCYVRWAGWGSNEENGGLYSNSMCSLGGLYEEAMYWNIPSCSENWISNTQPLSCNYPDTYIREYTDINQCNTSIFLPQNNGTSIPCENLYNVYVSLTGRIVLAHLNEEKDYYSDGLRKKFFTRKEVGLVG